MSVDRVPIVLVRDLAEPHSTRQQFARAARAGTEFRVARGAYMLTDYWQRLGKREQYIARIRAVAGTRRSSIVLSHWSAAALHGLPIRGEWPQAVHCTVPPASGGRSRGSVVKHAVRLADDDIVLVDGLLATSPARTA